MLTNVCVHVSGISLSEGVLKRQLSGRGGGLHGSYWRNNCMVYFHFKWGRDEK